MRKIILIYSNDKQYFVFPSLTKLLLKNPTKKGKLMLWLKHFWVLNDYFNWLVYEECKCQEMCMWYNIYMKRSLMGTKTNTKYTDNDENAHIYIEDGKRSWSNINSSNLRFSWFFYCCLLLNKIVIHWKIIPIICQCIINWSFKRQHSIHWNIL